jgi:hypothetical protein
MLTVMIHESSPFTNFWSIPLHGAFVMRDVYAEDGAEDNVGIAIKMGHDTAINIKTWNTLNFFEREDGLPEEFDYEFNGDAEIYQLIPKDTIVSIIIDGNGGAGNHRIECSENWGESIQSCTKWTSWQKVPVGVAVSIMIRTSVRKYYMKTSTNGSAIDLQARTNHPSGYMDQISDGAAGPFVLCNASLQYIGTPETTEQQTPRKKGKK